MKHRIVERPAFTLVGQEFHAERDGSVRQLWQAFLPRAASIAGRTDAQVLYGLCAQGEAGAFRYIAGAESSGGAVPEGMLAFQVPAQKYAVFIHQGTVEQIAESFQRIYAELLALRGLEPRQGPAFERYGEAFLGPDDARSQVELYVPVY
ncbi:GyrI-like domain-containing protein [Pseudomonas citronellolis]|uniref:GyrI-like domain-containing protein n=1 Tax=Pseudomonas citronellolis TaxID=53408 RepID=UPI0023E3E09B|nr:GyrI-like domain-containing protein [Pseudomonas citronellolis]MDF3933872.1 GyrI-like domain-containing protein [Pseudomonas citronellolis]